MSMICPNCKQAVIPGSIFCDNCGNKLPVVPPTAAAPQVPPPNQQSAAPYSGNLAYQPPAESAQPSQPSMVPPPYHQQPAPPVAPPPTIQVQRPAAPPVPSQAVQPTPGAAATLHCRSCGFDNDPSARFCERCGSALAAPAPASPAAPIPSTPPLAQEPVPPVAAAPSAAPVSAPAAPVEHQETPAAQPAAKSPSLTVVDSGIVLAFPPDKTEIIIGREDPVSSNFPDIDLSTHGAFDLGVSRQHCRLTLQDGTWGIEDLHAVNKTYLQQQVLSPGQRKPLSDGDEIVLGRLHLIYKLT